MRISAGSIPVKVEPTVHRNATRGVLASTLLLYKIVGIPPYAVLTFSGGSPDVIASKIAKPSLLRAISRMARLLNPTRRNGLQPKLWPKTALGGKFSGVSRPDDDGI